MAPEADLNKIYDNPAYKTKKCCYRHTIYTTERTHLRLITKYNQSIIASICPFFVLHQWLLYAKLTKPTEALPRCYVTSHW